MDAAIDELHEQYKKDQKVFTDWMIGIHDLSRSVKPHVPALVNGRARPSTKQPTELEREHTMKQLSHVVECVADNIKATRKLPRGINNALALLHTSLVGRRKCADFWHIKSIGDGKDR